MKKKWKLALGGAGALLLSAATLLQFDRLRYEGPAYEDVVDHGDLVIRRYEPRLVAETTVESDDPRTATREGFRRLAGFIFGGNSGAGSSSRVEEGPRGAKIAMTTPVERRATGAEIAMTSPVERRGDGPGYVVTFTMPSGYDAHTLPAPNDERVRIRVAPGRTVAVVRFSGRPGNEHEVKQATERLRELMRQHGYDAAGDPTVAYYDPPWVLSPFRRNEVQLPLEGHS